MILRAQTTAVLLAASLFVYGFLQLPRAGADETKVPQRLVADITFDRAGNPEAFFDLGQLSLEEKTTFVLEIANPTQMTFFIEKILNTCSCSDIRLQSKVLKPDESISLQLAFEPQKRATNPISNSAIILQMEPGRVITIRMRYSYDGLLAFTERSIVAEYGSEDRLKTFSIPFVITNPVDFASLELSPSKGLYGLDFKAKKDGDRTFVDCALNDQLFEKGGVGELTIRDPKLGRSDTIACVIERKPALKLMPNVIRFSSAKSDLGIIREEKAVLLLRIDPSYLHWKGEVEQKEESYVDIELGGDADGYAISHTRLTNGLYRIYISRQLKKSVAVSEEDKESGSQMSLLILVKTTEHDLAVRCNVEN